MAQTFATKFPKEEARKKPPKETQNDFSKKFLLVHILIIIKQFLRERKGIGEGPPLQKEIWIFEYLDAPILF